MSSPRNAAVKTGSARSFTDTVVVVAMKRLLAGVRFDPTRGASGDQGRARRRRGGRDGVPDAEDAVGVVDALELAQARVVGRREGVRGPRGVLEEVQERAARGVGRERRDRLG